mmetsp:Transcript_47937/g.155489  ORF Transcript_47937/g.155489 Transcript_47937/m.155489 type:complete len:252 (+) Transcript_47937:1190-1945(+)
MAVAARELAGGRRAEQVLDEERRGRRPALARSERSPAGPRDDDAPPSDAIDRAARLDPVLHLRRPTQLRRGPLEARHHPARRVPLGGGREVPRFGAGGGAGCAQAAHPQLAERQRGPRDVRHIVRGVGPDAVPLGPRALWRRGRVEVRAPHPTPQRRAGREGGRCGGQRRAAPDYTPAGGMIVLWPKGQRHWELVHTTLEADDHVRRRGSGGERRHELRDGVERAAGRRDGERAGWLQHVWSRGFKAASSS